MVLIFPMPSSSDTLVDQLDTEGSVFQTDAKCIEDREAGLLSASYVFGYLQNFKVCSEDFHILL